MESLMKAAEEMLLVNWLAKVTNDPVVQGAGPINVIGVGCNEDRWNRVARIDEVSIELESGHRRHMDVSDQAGGLDETGGLEEISCRRETLDSVAQRPHEPSHGLAKEPIIFDDRDQWRFLHTASGSSHQPAIPAHPTMPSRAQANAVTCAIECHWGNASAP
jgi:hypothetical protein